MVDRRACKVVLLLLLLLAEGFPAAAAGKPSGRRFGGLVLGVFPLAEHHPIIDGDTIKVEGLDRSLRLLCIDTEEIFHHPDRRVRAEADFAAYARAMRAERADGRPAKFGTPMGEAAAAWARRFFAGVHSVRLEIDDPRRQRGFYGRYLVYVFVKKEGRWVNYNLEAVRAGMAPYFVKYGRCERFDAEFRAAQAEARAAHRGIWGDAIDHYPDYDERLAWWEERAEAIERFRARAAKDPTYIDLMADDGLERALAHVGQTITVFSSFGEPRLDKKPYLLPLSHRRNEDFLIVAFDDRELASMELARWRGKLVYVRGKVSVYHGRPQFKARDVQRIWSE